VIRSPWQQFWNLDLPDNVHLVDVPLPQERSVPRRMIWEQVALPKVVRKHRTDVLFCPTDIASLLAPCKVVLAVQNLNPYLGDALQRGWRYYLNRKIILRSSTWMSARKAARVIFVSNFSRSVVCYQLGIPISKTEVVLHGVEPIFYHVPPGLPGWVRQLPQPYLLSVSSITAHKNYPFLVRAFVQMVRQSNLRHHLVIAGAPVFQKHVKEMHQIADQAGLGERLHLLGPVAHNELPALYRQADLFIFPSLLEVFGIPLVEAMASGVPVVTSNATSPTEICADAAVYFDPTDIRDAVDKISQGLTDYSLREKLVTKGLARATEFSWENAAKKTMSVLKAAVT
jgi:glycosyltransferase involved in cell wall biosynthesis